MIVGAYPITKIICLERDHTLFYLFFIMAFINVSFRAKRASPMTGLTSVVKTIQHRSSLGNFKLRRRYQTADKP
ncbi:hypothetical protein, partial [Yersinia pestis]